MRWSKRVGNDVTTHSIDLLVDDAALERRKAGWKPLPPRYTPGVLAKYARLAARADRGAITEA